MSAGCTDCGKKGGCDHRKGAMFAALETALARLYPTRRWDERDTSAEEGVTAEVAEGLRVRLAEALGAPVIARRGGPDELCDFLYVLCFGRAPSLASLAFDAPIAGESLASILHEAPGPRLGVDELHLRVALSSVAPFVGVQEVRLRLRGEAGGYLLEEEVRSGVFDPVLLRRFQRVVAVLTEVRLRHLDFGDLTVPPAGYAGGSYVDLHGVEPCIANYLFFPQHCSSITSTMLEVSVPLVVPAPPGRGASGTL